MLGTKPASIGVDRPYNLAAVTADLMWACALVTARVAVASAGRALELWSHTLRARTEETPSGTAGTCRPSHEVAPVPTSGAALPAPDAAAAAGPAPGQTVAFASYRSAGGHAAAQVTVAS